jgi:hypothetical protein
MTAKPVSLIDKMLERNAPKPVRPPDPVCPICSAKNSPVRLLRTTHGAGGYRCPQCLLAFARPVPSSTDLPAVKRCPECARKDSTIRLLVRLDWGWQWCPVCNYSEQVLSAAQLATLEGAKREAVGGCYGNSCKGISKGGGSKSGRKRGDGKRGFIIERPLDIERVRMKQVGRDGYARRDKRS